MLENLFKGLNGIYTNWGKDKWAVNTLVENELKDKLNVLLKSI